MSESENRSGLPPASASPFRTKNFNKFFFGIVIAAVLLAVLIFALFYGLGKHNHAHSATSRKNPATTTRPASARVPQIPGTVRSPSLLS